MENTINLGWGSPNFLDEYWKRNHLTDTMNDVSTQYMLGSSDTLKEGIKEIHRQHKNAKVDDRYIVIGNGATQILNGLINIIGKQTFARIPHFSRFPEMTQLSNLSWGYKSHLDMLQIITNPNNPDNSILTTTRTGGKLYDLSYNWKTYTNPVEYNEDIMVFSASKAFGMAPTRIGWAILRDKELAEALEHYIEINTAGVSIEAQDKACQVIAHVLETEGLLFDKGKEILDNRWKVIKELNLPFELLNESGMFIYAKGKCPESIIGINGKAFGDTEDKFRLNLGCYEEEFEELVRRLK